VNVLGEPLTGADRQRTRVATFAAGLLVNVVVNISLLDTLGWHAAVWGTYASEATQLLLLAVIAGRRRHRHLTAAALCSPGGARQ